MKKEGLCLRGISARNMCQACLSKLFKCGFVFLSHSYLPSCSQSSGTKRRTSLRTSTCARGIPFDYAYVSTHIQQLTCANVAQVPKNSVHFSSIKDEWNWRIKNLRRVLCLARLLINTVSFDGFLAQTLLMQGSSPGGFPLAEKGQRSQLPRFCQVHGEVQTIST